MLLARRYQAGHFLDCVLPIGCYYIRERQAKSMPILKILGADRQCLAPKDGEAHVSGALPDNVLESFGRKGPILESRYVGANSADLGIKRSVATSASENAGTLRAKHLLRIGSSMQSIESQDSINLMFAEYFSIVLLSACCASLVSFWHSRMTTTTMTEKQNL